MNDWDDYPVSFGSGSVQDLSPEHGDDEHPLAVLWLPDIEQTHGWRNHAVWPKPPEPKSRRPLGWR